VISAATRGVRVPGLAFCPLPPDIPLVDPRTPVPIATLGPAKVPSGRARVVPDNVLVPSDLVWRDGLPPTSAHLFEKAGPRPLLFFGSEEVRAGIVTCGGLCPGLNSVIRSLVLELHYGYGVRNVLGFRNGYRGLLATGDEGPIPLDPATVDDIHRDGGTMLGTSRGPVDVAAAVDRLIALGVNVLFTVGGDGTQRGGNALYEEARRRSRPLAVVGVPKTIDNDVPFVDRTFGFTTAVDSARDVIDGAHTEAHSVFNGVSVVKLMGRHAGFIAAAAAVASQDVNFCLIPEVPFRLEGPKGFLAALLRRVRARRHAVVVVAEGAGQDLLGGASGLADASGNARLKDVGPFLCEQITAAFGAAGEELVLRYFDPSYLIRSRPANTEDAVICDRFARHAVHAAMSGRTGLIIGVIYNQFVHVPVGLLATAHKRVPLDGELWSAVLAATGQPARFE